MNPHVRRLVVRSDMVGWSVVRSVGLSFFMLFPYLSIYLSIQKFDEFQTKTSSRANCYVIRSVFFWLFHVQQVYGMGLSFLVFEFGPYFSLV